MKKFHIIYEHKGILLKKIIELPYITIYEDCKIMKQENIINIIHIDIYSLDYKKYINGDILVREMNERLDKLFGGKL